MVTGMENVAPWQAEAEAVLIEAALDSVTDVLLFATIGSLS